MPKLGMEPIRRAALVQATIAEIGARGTAGVTVAQIARRAGMSTALAHHYGGGKDAMFLTGMRQVLRDYGVAVRAALDLADAPRARVEAVIRASFEAGNFQGEVVAAWLEFYALARRSPPAARLLRIYRVRLRSNLAHGLRPMAGDATDAIAVTLAALIDGHYLRAATGGDGAGSAQKVISTMDALLDRGR